MRRQRKMQINIVGKSNKSTDLNFWLKKSPEERVETVEFLRTQYYALSGYKTLPRFVPSIQIRESHK